jgi:hypothetical protein
VDLDNAFGELDLDYEDTGDGYVVTGRFQLRPGLVAAADAPELRRFLVNAERYLTRPLEVP